MFPLVLTLLQSGPTLVRAIGNLFGGDTAKTADSVAGVLDSVKGLSQDVAQAKLEQHLQTLTPEQMAALDSIKLQLATVEKEREATRLAADTAQQHEIQETARVEAQSSDEFVRRTRPTIARQSAQLTFYYAFITEVAFQAIAAGAKLLAGVELELPHCNPYIAATLFSPCLAYIGARTADAFSKSGKT